MTDNSHDAARLGVVARAVVALDCSEESRACPLPLLALLRAAFSK